MHCLHQRLKSTFFEILDCFLYFSRFLPYLIPEDPNSEEGESGPDLSTLRTFRVLRPLKLVSGVPSKTLCVIFTILVSVSRAAPFEKISKNVDFSL